MSNHSSCPLFCKAKKVIASLVVCCLLLGSLTLGSGTLFLTLGSLTLSLTLSSCSSKNNLAGDRGVAQEETGGGNERRGDERDDKNDNDGAIDHNDHPKTVRLIEPKVVRWWEPALVGVVVSVIIYGVTIAMTKPGEGYKRGCFFGELGAIVAGAAYNYVRGGAVGAGAGWGSLGGFGGIGVTYAGIKIKMARTNAYAGPEADNHVYVMEKRPSKYRYNDTRVKFGEKTGERREILPADGRDSFEPGTELTGAYGTDSIICEGSRYYVDSNSFLLFGKYCMCTDVTKEDHFGCLVAMKSDRTLVFKKDAVITPVKANTKLITNTVDRTPVHIRLTGEIMMSQFIMSQLDDD